MNLYLGEVEKFITELFKGFCDDSFKFHNFSHTVRVVQHALEIAAEEKLDPGDCQVLAAAAWFHDTGYLFVIPELHELKSVEIMQKFYAVQDVPAPVITAISNAILATKFPTHPQTPIERILCDADTFHFGTTEFIESNENVFLEFRLRSNGAPKAAFNRGTIRMLQQHKFYTTYCSTLLSAGKEKNIDRLIKPL